LPADHAFDHDKSAKVTRIRQIRAWSAAERRTLGLHREHSAARFSLPKVMRGHYTFRHSNLPMMLDLEVFELRPRPRGCYTCRFWLEANLASRAADRLKSAGYDSVVDQRFLAVEFADGFDALFVRLQMQCVETPPDLNLKTVIEEFERLNSRRTSVLKGLRRHASMHGVAVRENADSRWDLQLKLGTSEIHVGPPLTRLVDELDPAAALLELIKHSWLPQMNLQDANRLLTLDSDPVVPAPWRSDDREPSLFGPGILAIDCKALEGDSELPQDPADLVKTLAPTLHSPGQEVLRRFTERVGAWRFSWELCKRSGANFTFSDRLDSFRIHPRSKKLQRDAMQKGVEPIVDHLVTEFNRLDIARGKALRALRGAMAIANFVLDEDGDTWWFGRNYRRAGFKVGRSLTLALICDSPEDLVQSWLKNHDVLESLPSKDELRALWENEPPPIEKRWLPPTPPSTNEKLPRLADLDPAVLDQIGAECIRRALSEAEADPGVSRIAESDDLLYLWAKPFWYRVGDTWTTENWWVEFARTAWQKNKRDLAAVVLLSRNELPPGLNYTEAFAQYDCWEPEAFEDYIVWHFVDLLPWPIDADKYPDFPASIRPRPPQIIRQAARALRSSLRELRREAHDSWLLDVAFSQAAMLDREAVPQWISEAEMSELEARLKTSVQSGDFRQGPEQDDMFAVAAEFGWTWLIDALSNHRSFIDAQFNFQESYSEPGKVALRISWVKPCSLAARFAAHALAAPPEDVLEANARKIAGDPSFYESGRSIVLNWLKLDQFAAAIAWQRCRAAGVV
jgi:hypothetical protein